MIELRKDIQRKDYIQVLWSKLFGENPRQLDIEFVDVGALNYVYRISNKKEVIYLKQALEEAKNKEKIGSDLASIPKERIFYEEKYIEIVKPELPPEIELPKIMGYDKENNILVLSDVKNEGVLLETSLLDGNFNERTAYLLGRFLGITHRSTLNKKIVVRGSEEEDIKNWYTFLSMRTKGVLEMDKFPPEVEKEVKELYDLAKSKHTIPVLINMDCVPKNAFERKDGSIGLHDFELASGVGDPAYDLGFLVGHYLIMGVIRKDKITAAIKAMKEILEGYDEEMKDLKDSTHDKRVVKYAGIIPLYRISGSSPAPYVKAHSDAIPLMKKVAFSWITTKFSEIDEAINSLGVIVQSN